MEQENNNKKLLAAVRTVGIIKPRFNPMINGFDAPRLEINGTGFWLLNGLFMTCAHVVRDIVNQSPEIVGMLVVGGNDKPYRAAKISIIDSIHDIALLHIEPKNLSDVESLKIEIKDGLEVYDQHLDVGQDVAYAGFPGGNLLLNDKHSPTYAEGIIGSEVIDEKEGFKTIQISGPVVGGYSGSPIVLKGEFNKVVGIVSHSPSEEMGQASIFRSVHWRHLKELSDLGNS